MSLPLEKSRLSFYCGISCESSKTGKRDQRAKLIAGGLDHGVVTMSSLTLSSVSYTRTCAEKVWGTLSDYGVQVILLGIQTRLGAEKRHAIFQALC